MEAMTSNFNIFFIVIFVMKARMRHVKKFGNLYSTGRVDLGLSLYSYTAVWRNILSPAHFVQANHTHASWLFHCIYWMYVPSHF